MVPRQDIASRSKDLAAAGALPVLTRAELGRATLARQGLVGADGAEAASTRLDPVAAIERIGGLQAQEPASPFLALWARRGAADVDAGDLEAAFRARTVVKGTLMRATLHAVTVADYLALLPAVLPMLRGIRRGDRREPPTPDHLRRLAEAATAFTAVPRSLTELRALLAAHADGIDPDEVVWWLRRHLTFLHAPADEGTPWAFGRRPRIVEAAAWLGGAAFADPAEATRHLVRRHLAAFGPASAADIGAWSGVPIGQLRPALAALDAEGALWHATDERGRALVDLVDAPRPPAETAAPPRLLPMWDSVLLAHADRTRIIDDADRAVVVARNGDTLPTFLVDGRVAGLWWTDPAPGGRVHVAIEPFRRIDRAARRALEDEGERLAAFVEPFEPRVYGRYQRWRRRPTTG